jgi:hypothetical protein
MAGQNTALFGIYKSSAQAERAVGSHLSGRILA